MVTDSTLFMGLFDKAIAFSIGLSCGEDVIHQHEEVMSNRANHWNCFDGTRAPSILL